MTAAPRTINPCVGPLPDSGFTVLKVISLEISMDATTAESQNNPRLTKAIVFYFWPFVRPDWKLLGVSFLGLALQAAFSVLITMIPAILVRNWAPQSRHFLLVVVLGLLGINLAVLAVQAGVNWIMTNITENVVRRVRHAIFKKIGVLPSEDMSFHVVGKFAQRTTGDVMRLGGLVSPGLPLAVFSFLQLVFMFVALFWLDPRFAWTLPVSMIVIWVSLGKINERVRFWARKDQLAQEEVLTHFIETIGGVRDLVASGRFDLAAEHFNEELLKKQRFLVLSANWNNLAGLLPTAFFSFLVFGYYLWRVGQTDFSSGAGEVGTILAYGGNLLMAQGLVLTIFKLLTESQLAAPSLYELQRLLNAPEVKDPGKDTVISSGEVHFNDVTFTYGVRSSLSRRGKAVSARIEPKNGKVKTEAGNGKVPLSESTGQSLTAVIEGSKPVLRNVSYKIDPGKFAAIVGQSGSGKTTLFYMLLRLLEPTEGAILLGGSPLSHIPLKTLRNYIGFIPQAPFIFSGTIRENLLMGADPSEISAERMEHAIESACLSELIAKRQKSGGLDAHVGAGGASLSAGERQRIALARLFLRDPGVIVCDEYTANIDNATARLIETSLKTKFAGRTRIVISHQLYTVRGADCIFVLDEGEIVGQGTHESLLSEDGLYRQMWEVQRL